MPPGISHPTDRPNFTKVYTGKFTLYYSYRTLVAFDTVETGLICSQNEWSVTTGKHLNMIQPDHDKRIPHADVLRLASEAGLN